MMLTSAFKVVLPSLLILRSTVIGFNADLSRKVLSTGNKHPFSPPAPFGIFSPTVVFSSATDGEKTEAAAASPGEEKKPKIAPAHDVRSSGPAQKIHPEELKIQQALAEHQKNAPKLGFAVDVRSLVEYNHGFAVMCTNSKANKGFPGGSVVGFAPDELGRPLFIFSGMSSHTQDIAKDPRCSLTIASKEFKSAADGRVNLMGNVTKVPRDEIDACKAVYLKKHPGAFWVDFGDFNWYRMDTMQDIRFVGGFARAGSVTPEDYAAAQPDPIAAYGMKVAGHMNDDHMGATIGIIAGQIPGLVVTEAIITSVDSLGMFVKVTRIPRASDQPQQFKIRVPFPRVAKDRKDVKNVIVEMTMAAAQAAEAAEEEKKSA